MQSELLASVDVFILSARLWQNAGFLKYWGHEYDPPHHKAALNVFKNPGGNKCYWCYRFKCVKSLTICSFKLFVVLLTEHPQSKIAWRTAESWSVALCRSIEDFLLKPAPWRVDAFLFFSLRVHRSELGTKTVRLYRESEVNRNWDKSKRHKVTKSRRCGRFGDPHHPLCRI